MKSRILIALVCCVHISQSQIVIEQDQPAPQQVSNVYSAWAKFTYDNAVNESIQLINQYDRYIESGGGPLIPHSARESSDSSPLDKMIDKLKYIQLFWDRAHYGGDVNHDKFSAVVELRCLIQANLRRLTLAFDTRIPEKGLLYLCHQLDSRFELNLLTKMQASVLDMLKKIEEDPRVQSREILKKVWDLEANLKNSVQQENLMSAYEWAQGT
jgi:hypothetical protein